MWHLRWFAHDIGVDLHNFVSLLAMFVFL